MFGSRRHSDCERLVAQLEGQVKLLTQQLEWAFKDHIKLYEAHTIALNAIKDQRSQEVIPGASIPWTANAPMYISETEEDAQWQLDNNLISKEMYEEILHEAGLQNTEIQFET